MALWIAWWNVVSGLRPVCSRTRNFLWLTTVLAGMCVRSDLLGVSSLVRGLGLMGASYGSLLDFFHSSALDPNPLSRIWSTLALRIFPIPRFNGRLLLVGDGIKVPRAGRKMPAVKMLHQEAITNTKPEYIMGHSCQAVSLLAGRSGNLFAVPLAARIHEGVVFSNRDQRTLFDKMLSLIDVLDIREPFYFIGDAYYACKKMGLGLLRENHHLLTRVHRNAVAWTLAVPAEEEKRRGRPRKYGQKLKLGWLRLFGQFFSVL